MLSVLKSAKKQGEGLWLGNFGTLGTLISASFTFLHETSPHFPKWRFPIFDFLSSPPQEKNSYYQEREPFPPPAPQTLPAIR